MAQSEPAWPTLDYCIAYDISSRELLVVSIGNTQKARDQGFSFGDDDCICSKKALDYSVMYHYDYSAWRNDRTLLTSSRLRPSNQGCRESSTLKDVPLSVGSR